MRNTGRDPAAKEHASNKTKTVGVNGKILPDCSKNAKKADDSAQGLS
jgi:hypothetical protein